MRKTIFAFAMTLCLLFSSAAFMVISGGVAHASSLHMNTNDGWRALYNGHYLSPIVSHSRPDGYPNSEKCINVALTDTNYAFASIRVIMGITNNCPNSLTDVIWDVNTEIACGPGQFGGPGTPQENYRGSVSVGQSITLFNQTGHVECEHNGVPQPWAASTNASVDSDVVGESFVAYGSAGVDIEGY